MGFVDTIVEWEVDTPEAVKWYTAVLFVMTLAGMVQSTIRNELFDFKGQCAFYMAYHMDTVNVFIHVFCIPPILWSALGMFKYSNQLIPGTPEYFDLSFVAFALYASYYLMMGSKVSFFFGMSASAIILAMFVSVHTFADIGLSTYVCVHIMGWLLQFYGHGLHEKRMPALLTNLSQAVLMAPLFVYLEILAFFGYKKAFFKELKMRAMSLKHGTKSQ
mmetsp:Transcript_5161/g.9484  ORF Transcript_5161/g.9484 Transcript_5161/m.9484 type:complete len:218 (-) Transcript_5161:245-898(-)